MKHSSMGINDQLEVIAKNMTEFIDDACNLENFCAWYDDPDPQRGGPPTVDQLTAISVRLRAAYMAMALATGLDPCEQLPSTKALFKQRKSSEQIQ